MSQAHSKSRRDSAPAPTPAVPARPRRQALLVPGMHRSGTSALTGVLSHLGAQPPRTLLPNAKDNPRGFWESAEIVKFHDQILASAGSRWDDWEPLNRDWMDSAAAEPFLERVPELLEREYGDARLLLLKDPRICRLMPFWLEALARLDIAPRVVIPLRHPAEVAGSLEARNKFGRHRALLVWLRHVLEAEYATRGLPRSFLHYEDLLQDWRGQVQRIATELDIKWPRWSGAVEATIDEFLTTELRHQQAHGEQITPNPELQAWIRTAREATNTLLTARGHDSAAEAALDELREDFDRRASIFASVVSEYSRSHQRERDELTKDLEGERQSGGQARQELQALQETAEKQAARIAELESSGELNERQLTATKAAVETLSAQLALQDRVIVDMRGLLADRDDETHSVRTKAEIHQEELRRQIAQLASRVAELEALQAEASRQMAEQADQALARITELTEQAGQLSQAMDELEALTASSQEQSERVVALEGQLEEAQSQLSSTREELKKQTAETARVKQVLEKRLNDSKLQTNAWITRIDAGVRQVSEVNRDLSMKNREQARAISERFKEIEQLTGMLLQADGRLAERDAQATQLQMRIDALQRRIHAMETSHTWRLAGPVRRLARMAKRLRGGGGAQADLALVQQSELFDATWYLQQYPDVAGSGIDPAVHYLEFGALEGRDPGPGFDTRFYLQTYPDVAASGINPFVHFLRHGQSEERKARLSPV